MCISIIQRLNERLHLSVASPGSFNPCFVRNWALKGVDHASHAKIDLSTNLPQWFLPLNTRLTLASDSSGSTSRFLFPPTSWTSSSPHLS